MFASPTRYMPDQPPVSPPVVQTTPKPRYSQVETLGEAILAVSLQAFMTNTKAVQFKIQGDQMVIYPYYLDNWARQSSDARIISQSARILADDRARVAFLEYFDEYPICYVSVTPFAQNQLFIQCQF
ncbi:hypothetical protein IWQ60_005483 [Tieghemiomyces parasiticus]|uniref:Uncharacterized protein n=1 Tax=Tieghemiomyces parasiticus TaxID=78921 RepID=A0A9W8AC99_9FUNG|nr:hypothetical protein IWQ60_005483 [Tieghemiomyces parasiticus]